jgi:tetratricopeptide (TPR) repeat protein
MIRLITWLDPNWMDVYATGAWHLMYNFTDTDQRSDRRYLGPGIALLNEGIANNPTKYDMYKEKGWNAFDKLKDYDLSAEALAQGVKNDPKYDITQVGHLLAHSLERAGRIDDSIAQWKTVMEEHQKRIADKDATPEEKGRNESGLRSATENWRHLQIRKMVRPNNTQPPIDVQFTAKVTRIKPKVLKIEGTWRCWGTAGKSFDMGTLENPGKGVLLAGPTDGARVDVRLQDAGYQMKTSDTFSFDIDQSITIMQDQISTRDGKLAEKGGLFIAAGKAANTSDRPGQNTNVYQFSDDQVKQYGLGNVPFSKGLSQLSQLGKQQAVTVAYPLPYNAPQPFYSVAETATKFAELVKDAAKLADLDKKGYRVSQATTEKPGEYSRQFDMSKDPTMYSFSKDKYELILSLNPRIFPDNIQDRFGYSGEGLTDKKLPRHRSEEE